ETNPVRIKLEHAPIKPLELRAELNSPAFDIKPEQEIKASFTAASATTGWLITPKKLGRHAISIHLSAKDSGIEIVPDIDNPTTLDRNTVVAYVTVVDSLGFTAQQRQGATICGAAVALISTLVALPFFSALFGAKRSSS